MQKRTAVITASIVAGVLVLGGTAAIVGPLVYRDLIVGEAESAPTVTAAPSASTSPVTGRWPTARTRATASTRCSTAWT